MVSLSVYNPDAACHADQDHDAQIFSYNEYAASTQRFWNERLLNRAKLIARHRQCPTCRSARVLPLELQDGRVGADNRKIPGTSSIVGFQCRCCRAEWTTELSETFTLRSVKYS
jgi:hypothetical protein